MPAIRVASKMKSGLPKPVHSAAPIPQVTAWKQGVGKSSYSSQVSLKPPRGSSAEGDGGAPPKTTAPPAEKGAEAQIYTDWANHYLAKSGNKRVIKDLQQDVTDGVLLAEIIQVVANEKIEDINGFPKSRSQMIENIDACLSFLAAKGVNIQGLSAEEIRNGNLKAILGLFFSLSRYKQQQAQKHTSQPHAQHQHHHHHHHQPVSHQTSTPTQQPQSQTGTLIHGQLHTPSAQAQKAQAEMQSRRDPRLPGPTTRMSAAGSESKPRGPASASASVSASASNSNRRSQSFNSFDKSKPPPRPDSAHEKEPPEGINTQSSGMAEHAPPSGPISTSSSTSTFNSTNSTSSSSSAIPQPSSSSKPWRSKSLNAKHSATTSMFSVKQDPPKLSLPPVETPPKAAPVPQKSMLEKLKLFNSKGGSKSSGGGAGTDGAVARETGAEKAEVGSNTDPLEEAEGNARPVNGTGVALSSSPKIALKGIAQRTFSRALTTKKSSLKVAEKDKDKTKEKDKAKDASKRASVTERAELKEGPKEEAAPVQEAEQRKASKITSFIPKGGKASGAKKEGSAQAHSGIPKPGAKASGAGKTSAAPSSGKDGERPRSMRLSGGLSLYKGQLDGRNSSSSSSLASTEGKAQQPSGAALMAGAGTTQSTASNTVSVQLPHPQQQYSHPNTATVAPFMYRSQTDGPGTTAAAATEAGSGGSGDAVVFGKPVQSSMEDLAGEDPEARRLRTVKNIADLRQNLEETMSSLRGTQITHSTLETTFDGSVTTEISGRGVLSMASRSTPLSWRLGQTSPRLQAGDAPSMGNGYPPRANASRFVGSESGRYLYSGPLRRQLGARGSAVCGPDLADKVEELDLEGIGVDAPGYMSDGDVLSKNIRASDVTSGYMTDGGLSLYTRRLNRLPDGVTSVREALQRKASTGQVDADSWDDSSSVSSGISDTIDTDDINTSSSISSYANTPATPRKGVDVQHQTDAEKHSSVDRAVMWSSDEVRRSDGGSDSGVRMEPGSKWRRNPSDISDESDKSPCGRPAPAISQTGSWRRGMTAQVGITTPRTKTTAPAVSTGVKTHGTGKTDDAKVSEKGRLSPRSSGIQRSPSDAGRSSGDEAKKPPSSTSRTPTNTFGFKKQGSGMTFITASGATITSGSATLGKIPKSSGLIGGRSSGRKDGQQAQDDGYLPVSARANLQYRSLPRPSRNGARNGNRSSTSSIESNLSSKAAALPGPRAREPAKAAGGNPLCSANQTDREKGVSSDAEGMMPCGSIKASPTSQSGGGLVPQGGRQQGSKYADVSSPTLRRLFGGKPSKQAPVTTAENMKNSTVISNPHATLGQQGALDSPSSGTALSSGGSSPLYGARVGGVGEPALSSLASSPGSAYSAPTNSLTWGTTLSSSSALSKEGLGYPSVSSLHTSCESIDISLGSGSLGHQGPSKEEALSLLVRTGLSESPLSSPSASPKFSRNTLPRKQDSDLHLHRNTLPKKGLRYAPSPQLRSHEDAKEWLRSHSAGGLQDSASNSPFSPGSSITSPSGTRFNFAQLSASPTTAAQINLANLRTNSMSNQEGPYDPYSDSRLRNSSMSLDDKSRTMSRSGSFRDGFEEVHGSSLSLVSSTSSIYSTPEEKSQSEIRKLRRELDASQEKVSALTTQLSANAHLVAAFEQSLGNMTIRLQSLTMTAEQKDSELNELRKTIEFLKKQNAVAQAAINGVINTPELTCKSQGNGSASDNGESQPDLRIRRQHSSDSVSSITSATSHSSVGSNMDQDAKNKKKKKNWSSCTGGKVYELRSSFKQAFSKKKSPKSASSHSDIEEMTDSSLPSSPKLPHNGSSASTPVLRNSQSNSLLSECTDSEAETVMQLRSELRDKEMKLTDIRLEALSSAHQLDQLREAMNRMQGEIERLKAENDRLKLESQGRCSRAPSQVSIASSPHPSVGLSQHSLNLSESTSLDMLLDDSADSGSRKEGRHVKIMVVLEEDVKRKEECRPRHFLIGCIGVSGKTKWDVLDGVVRRLFKEYIVHVDPVSQLGLNSDSVEGYSIGDVHRTSGAETPELLPCGYLVGESNTISVTLKGVSAHSQDSLVFETLIPKPMLQRYFSLLQEHRRIILSGPSGTGKTFLASRLAEHMVLWEGRSLADGAIATFNVDHKSSKELRQYLSNLADQCNSESHTGDMPLVVILDNLHHVSSLGELFNGLLNCKYHRCPYIIGTMNQATSSTPNLQLHHNFRWVLCANHTEPVKGFLGRFLRRKLVETEMSSRTRNMELVKIIEWIPRVWHHLNRFLEAHSSSDVTIGPRLFLSCPIDVDGSRVWFTDLWNYSIIPYMLEAIREGLQLYGRRVPWEDPAKWVMDTYPWAASPQQHEWPPLLHLRPEDVGFDGYSVSREGCHSKQVPQSDTEGDPLMNMLMRLQEAANCSSPQSYDDSDSNSNSHHDDILDSSLESTL
ncbi:neuron navigator 2-like isoform X5 [Anguilla anguilla]|uniref:neuron navigator 2-like isoform X5 n=1 Tax=Anguilla anguilla TaxID=7936 RepID=UPI0015AEB8E0|nr:neuron navigator 2-like isoform X5 [Anguilla anguilla]